nr:tautomerase family protein [Nocardia brasiliensis]
MPLWTIHHTPGIFGDDEKRQLATRIADHYEKVGLPSFYVVTVFQETRPENFYVGGEPARPGCASSSTTSPAETPTRKAAAAPPNGSRPSCTPT